MNRFFLIAAVAALGLTACLPDEDKKESNAAPQAESLAPVQPPVGEALLAAVAAKRDAIRKASAAKDVDALAAELPNDLKTFKYTFGVESEAGPAESWRKKDAAFFESITTILDQPSHHEGELYWWPALFMKEPKDYTPKERAFVLKQMGSDWQKEMDAGTGYMGWRLWIHENGEWQGLIAGD